MFVLAPTSIVQNNLLTGQKTSGAPIEKKYLFVTTPTRNREAFLTTPKSQLPLQNRNTINKSGLTA